MPKPKFVGFQEIVVIPPEYKIVEVQESIACDFNKDQAFSYLVEPALLSRWFYNVQSIDSKPGGKVKFLTEAGVQAEAVCTSFILGKQISMVSDEFGLFCGKVEKSGSKIIFNLQFKTMTENQKLLKDLYANFVQNLRSISGSL
jgi:hypothetical protein